MNRHQSAATACLLLRYRPDADVLLGVVEVTDTASGGPDAVNDRRLSDTPDADTRLTWNLAASGQFANTPVLHSFEVIHALSRWQADGLDVLPRAVADICHRFTNEHREGPLSDTPTISALHSRVASEVQLPMTELLSTNEPRTSVRSGLQRDALHVARSLERLSGAIETAFSTRRLTDHEARTGSNEHNRVVAFCALARELASTLADHEALPAPGTSAATRQALRGGLPIGDRERAALLTALTDIDQPDRWALVAAALDHLAADKNCHLAANAITEVRWPRLSSSTRHPGYR